jgi:DNA-binding Xre family transcriptional regulator
MRRNKRKPATLKRNSLSLNLKPILASRHVYQPYKFLLSIGINNHITNQMLNHKVVKINLNHLSLLCQALNCTPNDLFAISKLGIPFDHPLQEIADMDSSAEEQSAPDIAATDINQSSPN